MSIQVKAIYENGVFRPLQSVSMAERQEVTVTIDANDEANSSRRNEAIDEFLQNIYALAQQDDLQGATDRIFETIDRLLLFQAFDACDDVLRRVDISRLPAALMRSLLTITYAARDRLPARKLFYDRVRSEIIRLKGEEKADRLLANLA